MHGGDLDAFYKVLECLPPVLLSLNDSREEESEDQANMMDSCLALLLDFLQSSPNETTPVTQENSPPPPVTFLFKGN